MDRSKVVHTTRNSSAYRMDDLKIWVGRVYDTTGTAPRTYLLAAHTQRP